MDQPKIKWMVTIEIAATDGMTKTTMSRKMTTSGRGTTSGGNKLLSLVGPPKFQIRCERRGVSLSVLIIGGVTSLNG